MASMKTLTVVAILPLTLAACGGYSRSGDVYTADQARHEMTVRMGVVESVREVQMEGGRSGVGGLAGGVVGGVAGSSIGGGKGQIVGAVLGAVAGGMAGNAIEQGASRRMALEITVRLDGGQTIAVVQEGDPMAFRHGDRVRVLSGRGETRVSR